MRLLSALAIASLLVTPANAFAAENLSLVEPGLRLGRSAAGPGKVALTLDACAGKTDYRILDTLVQNRIPATIFVTGRWLKHNSEAVAVLKAHPDLFRIENHGALHIPAVDMPTTIYGINAAGSADAVKQEVEGGARDIEAAGAPAPRWFRGATAQYSQSAIGQIRELGYRIAGYSLNGDEGASLEAEAAEQRIAAAEDGDVIIAHINQPTRPAGGGVAKGVLALKAKGMTFVHLEDAREDAPLVPARISPEIVNRVTGRSPYGLR